MVCLSTILYHIYHNSSLNNTAQHTAVAEGTDLTDTSVAVGATTTAYVQGNVNALRKQIPKNSRNYESLTGTLGAGFRTDQATLETFNNGTAGSAPYGTFLVSYSFENFKTPADDSGLYSGTSTLGSTVTAEMVHIDDTAADIFFYAECDKILSIDPLTQNFVVSD